MDWCFVCVLLLCRGSAVRASTHQRDVWVVWTVSLSCWFGRVVFGFARARAARAARASSTLTRFCVWTGSRPRSVGWLVRPRVARGGPTGMATRSTCSSTRTTRSRTTDSTERALCDSYSLVVKGCHSIMMCHTIISRYDYTDEFPKGGDTNRSTEHKAAMLLIGGYNPQASERRRKRSETSQNADKTRRPKTKAENSRQRTQAAFEQRPRTSSRIECQFKHNPRTARGHTHARGPLAVCATIKNELSLARVTMATLSRWGGAGRASQGESAGTPRTNRPRLAARDAFTRGGGFSLARGWRLVPRASPRTRDDRRRPIAPPTLAAALVISPSALVGSPSAHARSRPTTSGSRPATTTTCGSSGSARRRLDGPHRQLQCRTQSSAVPVGGLFTPPSGCLLCVMVRLLLFLP